MKTTIDKLLHGRFAFEQPARGHGYRVAVDTLLMAAAVPVKGAERVLELGCGVGAAMLAVAVREIEAHITGLELQEQLATLCTGNIERNEMTGRMTCVQGDVAHMPQTFHGAFDHVMTNPPFHVEKSHDKSPIKSKALAHTESEAELPIWLESAHHALKTGGVMTMIHRADRQKEITEHAVRLFEKVEVKPIISRKGKAPKRIIVRGYKGEGACAGKVAEVNELAPFILYGDGQDYSVEAELILRDAMAMAD